MEKGNARQLLIVDDEPRVVSSIKRLMRNSGVVCHGAADGSEGIRVGRERAVGVVLSDLKMPRMDGVTFLAKISAIRPDAVRILLTGHSSKASAIEAVNRSGVFLYLTKPWNDAELLAAIDRAFRHYELKIENRRLMALTREQNKKLTAFNQHLEALVEKRTGELHEAVRTGILMLVTAAEAKDDVTGEHIQRIAQWSETLSLAMGIGEKAAKDIGFFSMMHDVGKLHIPDHILRKEGKLTDEEYRIVQQHPVAGEKIIGDSKFYAFARQIARHHHERWDGTGYPDGLVGEAIPLAARIVSVVDVYDALTSDRPYKKAWPKEVAVKEIEKLTGTFFDPTVVAAFLSVLGVSNRAKVNGCGNDR